MMKCDKHPNIELRPLFTSSFCPECEAPTAGVATTTSFEELSSEAKRVAIAKEVLQQISANKIIPSRGDFIRVDRGACEVCAIGSLIIGCAYLVEGVTPSSYDGRVVIPTKKLNRFIKSYSASIDRRNICEILEPYFPVSQLEEIEAAFESTTSYAACTVERQLRVFKAAKFSSHEVPADITLTKIMENIITNNGTFIP